MTLATFERALKDLFMTPAGKAALQSEATLQKYLAALPLSRAERETIAEQPLERLQQYEYMLWANVEDTLQSIFPFTVKLLDENWDSVARDYFWKHPSPSYHLIAAAQEFPHFLETQAQVLAQFPFLPQLAQYEYVEAELLSARNPIYPSEMEPALPGTPEDLACWIPVLNPNCRYMYTDYPVPAIAAFLKENPIEAFSLALFPSKPTAIWIYRQDKPYTCRFFELNAVLASWLSMIKEAADTNTPMRYSKSARKILTGLQPGYPDLTEDYFYGEFIAMLKTLQEKGIIVGSVPAE